MEHVVYQLSKPERWDYIAFKAYGDSNLSAEIIRANPGVDIVALVPAGTILKLPIKEQISLNNVNEDLLPPWKR